MEMRQKFYVIKGIHYLGNEGSSYESYDIARVDDEAKAWELFRSYAGAEEDPVLDFSGYYDGEVRVLASAAQIECQEDQVVLLEVTQEEEEEKE